MKTGEDVEEKTEDRREGNTTSEIIETQKMTRQKNEEETQNQKGN